MSDPIARFETGVKNLDAILDGGLPKGAAIVIAGAPGSGKTILAQQICFHNCSEDRRVLYFSTLSEPPAKTLRYLAQFDFFEARKLEEQVEFVDLGAVLQSEGLADVSALMMQHVKRVAPAIVVIDSFKVFDDVKRSRQDQRKFGYELAVSLMAWEATVLMLGEYAPPDYETNPLFSIVDGLLVLGQSDRDGDRQRVCRIVKMRGTGHSADEHPFLITRKGIEMFPTRLALRRRAARVGPAGPVQRCKTFIDRFDDILGPGIPWGSSLLLGGVAGTGKTVLGLEFVYRGALAGEKGIFFSFEETQDRLLATARGLGWTLDEQVELGNVEIVFIPQPDILIEADLLMIQERVERLRARRVVIDSVSVFLHKVSDPQLARERVFHLCTIVQNAGACAFFTTDIPYGSSRISRLGVEETVVDGVAILSSTEEGLERERYIEVYKLRNTSHLKGRHNLAIGPDGITIFPRYGVVPGEDPSELRPLVPDERLSTGTAGLDELMGGGLLKRSITLLSGSAGCGKTTIGLQYVLAGAALGEVGLYVTLEESPAQLMASAEALGLPLAAALANKTVEVLYISRELVRAGQFLTVLTDRLRALKATRVVVDAVSHLLAEQMPLDELAHLLYKLVVRFKALDVTSLLHVEAPSLTSDEISATGRSLSPVADNLVLLRYARTGTRLAPTITIVKTRGSAHDRSVHLLETGPGGLRVLPGPALLEARTGPGEGV